MKQFSDAFWKWFGDSKVVDARGEPLVVYHSTGAEKDFHAFKRRMNDVGIHFGTLGQAEDRMEYLESRGKASNNQRIIPVYLSIKKPLRLKDAGWWDHNNLEYALRDKFGVDAVKSAMRANTANAKTAALRNLIENRGYDGIVYKNEGETAGAQELRDKAHALQKAVWKGRSSISKEEQETPQYYAYQEAEDRYTKFREANAEDSWIAFHPNQIKSVYNDGTWNRADNDMRSNPPSNDELLEEIADIAANARKNFFLEFSVCQSNGNCQEMSEFLYNELIEHGNFDPVLVLGEFAISKHNTQPHTWVEVDGAIIDISADQFGPKFPKVWVNAPRKHYIEGHRYFH